MFGISRFTKHLSAFSFPVVLLLGQCCVQAAPVTVMNSVSPEGVNYLYDLAITNNSAADPEYNLISVDFSLPTGTIIGTATAPAGNGATTDPSGDFVELSSDDVFGFPLETMVDGFQFLSASQFSSFSFIANYLDSTGSILTTVNGTTSPQTSAVPEPATLWLLASALLLLYGRLRLRRARMTVMK